jgi:hypothetical protein
MVMDVSRKSSSNEGLFIEETNSPKVASKSPIVSKVFVCLPNLKSLATTAVDTETSIEGLIEPAKFLVPSRYSTASRPESQTSLSLQMINTDGAFDQSFSTSGISFASSDENIVYSPIKNSKE